MTKSPLWSEHERSALLAISDLLVPASDGMPSASEVDVHGAGIDEVGAIREDLVIVAKALVHSLNGIIPSNLDQLREAAGPHFGGVSELLASAYFLRPEVAELIGYRQRIAIPLDDEGSRSQMFDELTLPVVGRGNVWKQTPPSTAAINCGLDADDRLSKDFS